MPKIPDEMWKCPKCGAGFNGGEGLTGADYTTWEEYKNAYKDEHPDECDFGCYCEACGWSGTPKQVYDKAMKRAGRKKCPCCKGTGWVEGEKA